MANPIIVSPDLVPDPDGCLPGTRQGMINFVAEYLNVMFGSQGGSNPSFIYTGSTAPSPEEQSGLWFRTESNGLPIGLFIFYNGKWIRTGIPLYSIWFYEGPASNFSSGKGLEGTQVDGFVLCNGENGSPDLRNKFPVGAAAYTSQWVSNVDTDNPQSREGGNAKVVLTRAQIPELPLPLPIGTSATGGLQRFTYGNVGTSTGTYSGTIPGTGNGSNDDGLSPAAAHTNLPPWQAACFIQFNPLA